LLSQRRIYCYFDADFVPQKTGSIKPFLILRIQNWGCSNPLGTSKPQLFGIKKIQAFALDAHFTLEQVGRNSKLHFINFNGTAGVEKAMYSGWELGK
jgi:hypothetical protein